MHVVPAYILHPNISEFLSGIKKLSTKKYNPCLIDLYLNSSQIIILKQKFWLLGVLTLLH